MEKVDAAAKLYLEREKVNLASRGFTGIEYRDLIVAENAVLVFVCDQKKIIAVEVDNLQNPNFKEVDEVPQCICKADVFRETVTRLCGDRINDLFPQGWDEDLMVMFSAGENHLYVKTKKKSFEFKLPGKLAKWLTRVAIIMLMFTTMGLYSYLLLSKMDTHLVAHLAVMLSILFLGLFLKFKGTKPAEDRVVEDLHEIC